MGCLSVNIRRIGGVAVEAQHVGGIAVEAERIGGVSVTASLVCGVDIGPILGIIWASDGKLITAEGGYLIGATE